jgi:hypothetical protein
MDFVLPKATKNGIFADVNRLIYDLRDDHGKRSK